MDEVNSNMKDLSGIIREAIEVSKASGLWQKLSLREKESVVKYIYFLENLNDI